MGREEFESAEQPHEKSELQEPVRGAPGRPVVRGWSGRLEQQGQEDFIQGWEEEEDLGGRPGDLWPRTWSCLLPGASQTLCILFCPLASRGIFRTQI